MAYYSKRRSTRKGTRKRYLKRMVKQTMLNSMETKKISCETSLDKNSASGYYGYLEAIRIGFGNENHQRNGDKVLGTGLSFEIIANNTGPELGTINDQPLFVSWAIVSGVSEVMDRLTSRFFKSSALIVGNDAGVTHSADLQGFPTKDEINGDKKTAAMIHTWPLNNDDLKIIKRGNFRLGTPANDSLVGPTFHHITGFCPLKMPIQYDKRRITLDAGGGSWERHKELKLVCWVTDPTAEEGSSFKKCVPETDWKIHLRTTLYFKDV